MPEASVTVYVLRSNGSGKRYVGITKDLNRRLQEHRSGNTKASHLLGAFEMVHQELFSSHAEARQREIFLKSGQGRKWLDSNLSSWPAGGG